MAFNKFYRVKRTKPHIVNGKVDGERTSYGLKVTGQGEIVTLTPLVSEAKTVSSAVKSLIEQRYAKRNGYGRLTFEEVQPTAVDLAEMESDTSVATGEAFEQLQREVKSLRDDIKRAGELEGVLRREIAERDQQLANRDADIKRLSDQLEGADAHIEALNKQLSDAAAKIAERDQPPMQPKK